MKKNRTLITKLTVAHTTGFFLSIALCFAAIYSVQHHVLDKGISQKLIFYANEFQHEYLTVTDFTPQHTILDPFDLPEACYVEIEKLHPGFQIFSVVRNPSKNIEVVGQQDGETFYLTFSPDCSSLEADKPIPAKDRVEHLKKEFAMEFTAWDHDNMFFLLLAPDGSLLARSAFLENYLPRLLQNGSAARVTTSPGPVPRRRDLAKTSTIIHNQGIRIRTLRHVFPDGNVLLIGANLSEYDKTLNRLLLIFGISLVILPAISLGIAYHISARLSAAVRRFSTAAREIEASGDYSKRLHPTGEGIELDRLAESFNSMTAKTERLISEIKTISENIAHDLRTPLTRIRGKAELALYASDPELAGFVAEECGNMLEMINTILEITEAEYHFSAAPMTHLDLRALVQRSLEIFSTIAEDKQIALTSKLPADPVPFTGHPSKLQRLIANLLDNAVKFTPRGGSITVTLSQSPEAATLIVSDTGCGIPENDLPHIFDRFYRSSASRTLPGNGLGLSLVRAIAIAHRGEINVASTPGKGTIMTLRFPPPGA